MYTIFGASRTLKLCITAFAVLSLLLAAFLEPPESYRAAIRWALISTSIFMAILTAIAGTGWYYSPWRMAFRKWPKLNEWVYPDLNGIWYGTTQSNWSVIEKVRTAASGTEAIDLNSLSAHPLREGEIAMEIKANIFRISIKSRVKDVQGTSHSVTSRADKSLGDYNISYIYLQDTPSPAATDESTHKGAASLKVRLGAHLIMEGEYWTRRKWREGMNTAGLISVKRVSSNHCKNGSDILKEAVAYLHDI